MGVLQGIMEHYGSVAHRYGMLRNVTEVLWGIVEHYRTSRSVAWRYGTLRNVTELLQNVTESLWKISILPIT